MSRRLMFRLLPVLLILGACAPEASQSNDAWERWWRRSRAVSDHFAART